MAHVLHELANVAIMLGYVTAGAYFVLALSVRRVTKIAGVMFFLTCAGTHLLMVDLVHRNGTAAGWTVWHIIEAVAIWTFLAFARRDALLRDG